MMVPVSGILKPNVFHFSSITVPKTNYTCRSPLPRSLIGRAWRRKTLARASAILPSIGLSHRGSRRFRRAPSGRTRARTGNRRRAEQSSEKSFVVRIFPSTFVLFGNSVRQPRIARLSHGGHTSSQLPVYPDIPNSPLATRSRQGLPARRRSRARRQSPYQSARAALLQNGRGRRRQAYEPSSTWGRVCHGAYRYGHSACESTAGRPAAAALLCGSRPRGRKRPAHAAARSLSAIGHANRNSGHRLLRTRTNPTRRPSRRAFAALRRRQEPLTPTN